MYSKCAIALLVLFTVVTGPIFAADSSNTPADNRTLLNANPYNKNTKVININDIYSQSAQTALSKIDLVFEITKLNDPFLGSGTFNIRTSAILMVFNKEGKVVGFMSAALITNTAISDVHLVAAFVDVDGNRIGKLKRLITYLGLNDMAMPGLPKELMP